MKYINELSIISSCLGMLYHTYSSQSSFHLQSNEHAPSKHFLAMFCLVPMRTASLHHARMLRRVPPEILIKYDKRKITKERVSLSFKLSVIVAERSPPCLGIANTYFLVFM